MLAGGKRLRPAFCHWGAVAAGGDGDDQLVVDAGAALELMHAFALFHDDVMDDAASRRGAPTTHVVFAGRHEAGNWAGEARRFGEGVAILVGDLAFVFADQLMTLAPPAAWAVWNELRIELNVGQLLDIVGSVRRDRSLAKAERICRYKSGKYTIERPLHLGAALVDPEHGVDLFGVLSDYGLPLGDAFQLRDDVMGAFGDPLRTGKPVGGDLVEGKPTPLLARAVAAVDGRAAHRPRPRRRPRPVARRRRPHPGGHRRHRRPRRPGGPDRRAHRRRLRRHRRSACPGDGPRRAPRPRGVRQPTRDVGRRGASPSSRGARSIARRGLLVTAGR